ncbi:MAG TPA: prepilin-type N-terminal cleavage/methylation domain-containing protein [Candidatus Ozemobacteraceae bacterium]|nr:prepilin-type N-terminal cleavage/methylation domain-containing protein [Candidatus Ozemobacteraceae bacterium]
MLSRCGFSLVELLIVVMLLGVLATTGIRFFSRAANDTRLRTGNDAIESMLHACQQRARQRGFPVQLVWSGNAFQISGSPAANFPVPELTPATRTRLSDLQFFATGTLLLGQRVSSITVSLIVPGAEPATVFVPLLP